MEIKCPSHIEQSPCPSERRNY